MGIAMRGRAAWGLAVASMSALVLLATATDLQARTQDGFKAPTRNLVRPAQANALVYETRLHYAGQVWLAVSGFGIIGTAQANNINKRDLAELHIDYSPSLEFPAGTRNDYLFHGGVWIGGIIGTDTLMSIPIDGASAPQDELSSYDTLSESSNDRSSLYFETSAKAEQEYYSVFADTVILNSVDEIDQRPHRPLHVEVAQRSYAWSDLFSRQFVIIEDWVRNIGSRPISNMTFGLFEDADIFNENTVTDQGALDDISGFLSGAPNLTLPQFRDSLNIAWVADNDGDPIGGTYPLFSPRGAVGIRFLRTPAVRSLSFNWWLGGGSQRDWGPVKAGARTPSAPGGTLGVPRGDRNMYYMATNGEIDYGQIETNVNHTTDGWRPPPRAGACDISMGDDTRQLISVGPMIDLVMPGDSVPFVFAIVSGNNLHTDPDLSIDCTNPTAYAASLDFSDLAFAATWASWIYDTPGFDTDGDGYRGEYYVYDCDSVVNGFGYGCDTIYYTGDLGPPPGPRRDLAFGPPNIGGGQPDFAGPGAPPCPELNIETLPSEIVVRWTGRQSETTVDPLTKTIDFEEYRLYMARINTPDQYSLIASWDINDYTVFAYDPEPPGSWQQLGTPVPLTDLQAQYGANFDPTQYATPSPQNCFEDTVYDDLGNFVETRCLYFEPQGFNQDNEYINNFGALERNVIQKMGDSVAVDDLTGDTLRFGYYEAHMTNMNPALGHYISVTAWDFGNPSQRLEPAESGGGPGAAGCWEYAIPIYSADIVKEQGLKVSVFPNPYKIRYAGPNGRSTSYYEQGFEAPGKQQSGKGLDEQDRRIWFINLPDTATIKIYTLDGDLVRTIEHVYPKPDGSTILSDYSSRAAWDLVTRNAQAAVSGIYIYRVESRLGSQLGKIVIIK